VIGIARNFVARALADLVDHEQASVRAVVAKPLVERAGGLLGAELEQELRGRGEEDGVTAAARPRSRCSG
jgi:hypothetical protein